VPTSQEPSAAQRGRRARHAWGADGGRGRCREPSLGIQQPFASKMRHCCAYMEPRSSDQLRPGLFVFAGRGPPNCVVLGAALLKAEVGLANRIA
jgi:hypothetical protein